MTDGTKSGRRRRRSTRHLSAGNHDRSGPEVFLLVDAQRLNSGTVKSHRNQWVRGVGDNFTFRHPLYDALSGCGKGSRAGTQQR